MKRILILGTGGIIVSGPGEAGLRPSQGLKALLARISDLTRIAAVDFQELMSVDSVNMQPENWRELARAVWEARRFYDGVVITHGTATMSFSASALSFFLPGLDIPVVFTGAQVPAGQQNSDAEKNLIDAMRVAVYGYSGVFIVFAGSIILGVRAHKVRSRGRQAFISVNSPPVGYVQDHEVVFSAKVPISNGMPQLADHIDARVAVLQLVPGTTPEQLLSLAVSGVRAIIVLTYGLGGLPFIEPRNFLPAAREIIADGVILAITTQCLWDGSDLDLYQIGRRTQELGVIPGRDMTISALTTKLMWILGKTNDLKEVQVTMARSLCGEVREGYASDPEGFLP